MVLSVPGARGIGFVGDAWSSVMIRIFDFLRILLPSIGIRRRFIYVTKHLKKA